MQKRHSMQESRSRFLAQHEKNISVEHSAGIVKQYSFLHKDAQELSNDKSV